MLTSGPDSQPRHRPLDPATLRHPTDSLRASQKRPGPITARKRFYSKTLLPA